MRAFFKCGRAEHLVQRSWTYSNKPLGRSCFSALHIQLHGPIWNSFLVFCYPYGRDTAVDLTTLSLGIRNPGTKVLVRFAVSLLCWQRTDWSWVILLTAVCVHVPPWTMSWTSYVCNNGWWGEFALGHPQESLCLTCLLTGNRSMAI